MIVIDGQNSGLAVKNFENLEEIFVNVAENGHLADRIVTDVFVDGEPFSEIYPHQSEDLSTEEFEKVEISTRAVDEVAVDITRELYKVVTIMGQGSQRVAEMFRRADDAEALDTYQDLIDVTRNFIMMIGTLRDNYSLKEHKEYVDAASEFSELFTEMNDVLENEDWILLADLLEYEFFPAVERWKKVIAQLREDIRVAKKEH